MHFAVFLAEPFLYLLTYLNIVWKKEKNNQTKNNPPKPGKIPDFFFLDAVPTK